MQVVLNWTASVTPNVLQYNIYRGLQSGGPYQLIGQSNPNPQVGLPVPQTTIPTALTTYTDITAPNGQDSYYVVTAVTIDGEGAYSAEFHAVAPSAPTPPTNISGTIS